MDRIYCAEQIVVPPELPAIIKAYSKEVIRYQPEDLVAFSRDYFASLSQGQHKGFLAKLESEAHKELLADIERKADEVSDLSCTVLSHIHTCVCVCCMM
jgi:hypothetical protein